MNLVQKRFQDPKNNFRETFVYTENAPDAGLTAEREIYRILKNVFDCSITEITEDFLAYEI